ncbi:MAG: ribosome biogenesis GTP-binding protein YihA/YsxC [Acidimicrobiales bacterium]
MTHPPIRDRVCEAGQAPPRPMTAPLELQFVLSAPHVDQLPPSSAEVAVVGRSNVGKSSLINALSNRKDLAHVSKSPGRTQLLNLYEHRGGGTLVDLPGYGYAAVSRKTRATWPEMISTYLLTRDALDVVLVLVDGEIGPTKLDVETLEWLRANDLPIALVATKHDKVKAATRSRRKVDLATGCGVAPPDVQWVSAAKGTGIEQLRGRVRNWLAG